MLSVILSYFAAEMKKKLLYIALLFLSVTGSIMAQELYLCRGVEADAYELNAMMQLEMETDSFRIRQQPAYAIEKVDSIVFHHPLLSIRELGWWGNMTNGQSLYKAHLSLGEIYPEIYGIDPGEIEPFEFDVLFIIEAQDSICQSVRCETYFSELWMRDMFYHAKALEVYDDDEDSPYIYVKETATGPRRFETWVINGPVLPKGSTWHEDGTMLWADCTGMLSGRPIEDVQMIVEAWVYQPPKLTN